MIKPQEGKTPLEPKAITVQGGIPLEGSVAPDGAKNSSLYALLTSLFIEEGWMTFENVPMITDIKMTLKTLEETGLKYKIHQDTLKIYGHASRGQVSDQFASKIRSSTTLLGPLISRFGHAVIPLPGGDKIGDRPINYHLQVMKAFGVDTHIEGGFVHAKLEGPLTGRDIYLTYPSVGATINAIFMAIKAQGTSVIFNAAKEPEIVDLISILSKMGADIHGGGTQQITIKGVDHLKACSHDIMPDRLEAGALLMSFAVTGGKGQVRGSIPDHNFPLIHLLRSTGIQVQIQEDVIHIDASRPKKGFDVETSPYPGLATDLQAVCTAFALTCPARSSIKDTVFKDRFGHVDELRKMGAQIQKEGNKIHISPTDRLSGGRVKGGDIRSVVSLILAALSTEDQTTIEGVDHLLRGHVNFIDKLQKLNSNIQYT